LDIVLAFDMIYSNILLDLFPEISVSVAPPLAG